MGVAKQPLGNPVEIRPLEAPPATWPAEKHGDVMASRICSKPGCPQIHDGATGSRCPDHTKAANKEHWNRTRAYSSKGHRTFRAAVLDRDPVCVICTHAVATRADHYPKGREDLIQLGMNPNDPAHGRGLCESCHNTETARNQPGGWNAAN